VHPPVERFESSGAAPAPGRRRIPAPLWDAAEEARRLRSEAHASAERLLADAEVAAEDARRLARVRGREEGLATATETLAAAVRLRDRWLAGAERELVELALVIARSVIAEAAERDPQLVVETARRALEAARRRRDVTLRASPQDVAALRAAEPRLAASLAIGHGIVLLADPAVGRGGVVVETEAGTVDASLDAQLAGVRRALLGDDPAVARSP
jgi:flagellar biosynthesis/type III secretory pathway protein FliH